MRRTPKQHDARVPLPSPPPLPPLPHSWQVPSIQFPFNPSPRHNHVQDFAPPPAPTNEVADKISNTSTFDNSWSFVNFHLPSSTLTITFILIFALAAWFIFKIYNFHCRQAVQIPQASPATLSTPMVSLTTPSLWSTPLDLPKTTPTTLPTILHSTNISASGPPPPRTACLT